jgi:hypothetical protein
MAAGVTERLWEIGDIVDALLFFGQAEPILRHVYKMLPLASGKQIREPQAVLRKMPIFRPIRRHGLPRAVDQLT